MKQTTPQTLLCLLAGCVLAVPAASAQLVTVATYDENTTQTNTIEVDPASPGSIISSSATNAVNLADFTSAVATAYNNNLGGVIDFESGSLGQQAILGANGSGNELKMDLSFTGWEIAVAGGSERTPISGSNRLNADASSGGVSASMTFGDFYDAGDNLLSGYGISEIGITMLARDNRNWNGTVEVTFSDATTDSYSISGLGDYGSGLLEDTFLGFSAPAGTFITGISFTDSGSSGGYTLTTDDLGVVVVPEPSTYAILFGLAGLGLALRNRRRK